MKNVILVTLDATRRDVFGVYGDSRGLTPCCDELAEKSVVFEKAQSTGPYTQAAFPGILTSSHYLDFGEPRGLAKARTLVSEPLHEAGVTTAAFHSNPYLCAYLGWDRGWDVFYDSMEDEVGSRVPYIRGDIITQKAGRWLREHAQKNRNDPFFLWVHYMDVHEPYVPERRYIDLAGLPIELEEEEMYRLFQDVLLKRDVSDPEQVRILSELYAAHVREVDQYVEELLDSLDRVGLLGETAIFVTSDHGDEFGEHGGLSHDDKMYCELVDVPLFVYGIEDSGIRQSLVSTIDIAPTITDLFGLPPVMGFMGEPLFPHTQYQERAAFSEAIDMHAKRGGDIDRDTYCYRKGDLKLIYRRAEDAWEHYDLASDLSERKAAVEPSKESLALRAELLCRVRRWEEANEQ